MIFSKAPSDPKTERGVELARRGRRGLLLRRLSLCDGLAREGLGDLVEAVRDGDADADADHEGYEDAEECDSHLKPPCWLTETLNPKYFLDLMFPTTK